MYSRWTTGRSHGRKGPDPLICAWGCPCTPGGPGTPHRWSVAGAWSHSPQMALGVPPAHRSTGVLSLCSLRRNWVQKKGICYKFGHTLDIAGVAHLFLYVTETLHQLH